MTCPEPGRLKKRGLSQNKPLRPRALPWQRETPSPPPGGVARGLLPLRARPPASAPPRAAQAPPRRVTQHRPRPPLHRPRPTSPRLPVAALKLPPGEDEAGLGSGHTFTNVLGSRNFSQEGGLPLRLPVGVLVLFSARPSHTATPSLLRPSPTDILSFSSPRFYPFQSIPPPSILFNQDG